MKHAIQRYPEVTANQDFVNLITATLLSSSEYPRVLREVTIDDHRAGTISAYLHSTLEVPCQFQIVSQSLPAATAIQDRTGLFCEQQFLAFGFPDIVHTTFGLELPENIICDAQLQLTVCTLLNFSSRALLMTCGLIKNANKCHTVGLKKYRTPSQLTELLQPSHSFYNNDRSSLVMAWFK